MGKIVKHASDSNVSLRKAGAWTAVGGVLAASVVMCAMPRQAEAQQAAKKPNVILLITDDMGWGDPGSYGFDRGVKTAALDRMAAEEIRFGCWYGETVDGEFTTVDDIAQLALLFAGFESNALTGQSLIASHGWSMELLSETGGHSCMSQFFSVLPSVCSPRMPRTLLWPRRKYGNCKTTAVKSLPLRSSIRTS